METPPNPIYTKEMVDLLMRIKKHLLSHQQVAIRLSDPSLFDKLVKIHPKDDPLLHGMLQYLMALGGPEWSQIYSQMEQGGGGPQGGPSADKGAMGLLKRGASLYRGMIHSHGQESETASPTETAPDAGTEPANQPASGERKPVRYYRGQPVYDDE